MFKPQNEVAKPDYSEAKIVLAMVQHYVAPNLNARPEMSALLLGRITRSWQIVPK